MHHQACRTSIPQHLPSYRPSPSKSAHKRLTNIDLHRYFGFCTIKNIQHFKNASKPTVTIADADDIPQEIGAVANIQRTSRNKSPVVQPTSFFDEAHMGLISALKRLKAMAGKTDA